MLKAKAIWELTCIAGGLLLLLIQIKVVPNILEPQKSIPSIILEMRKSYFSLPPCKRRDLDYAIQTSVWACESIIHYLKYSSALARNVDFEPISSLGLEKCLL